jgi:hypothetical protein
MRYYQHFGMSRKEAKALLKAARRYSQQLRKKVK